jgi:hypothetical protein
MTPAGFLLTQECHGNGFLLTLECHGGQAQGSLDCCLRRKETWGSSARRGSGKIVPSPLAGEGWGEGGKVEVDMHFVGPLTRPTCRLAGLSRPGERRVLPLTRRRLCRRRPLDGQGRGVLGPVFHCCEGRSPGKHQHDGQFFRGKDTQADRAKGPGHPPIGGFSLLKIFPQFACVPSTPNYNRLLSE